MLEDKLKVIIYGATGAVGGEAVISLANSQSFEITHLFASERSAGKPFREACKLDISNLPENILNMIVKNTDMGKIPEDADIAFFAFPEDKVKEYELRYAHEFAKQMIVVTTSSALRMHEKVPLIIPEVNAEHMKLAEDYKKEYNSKGVPLPQCNCTAVPLAVTLRPLLDELGIEAVFVNTYQAISGAGAEAVSTWEKERINQKGLPKPFLHDKLLDIPIIYDGNVRPIGVDSKGEEEKVRTETLKMLGTYEDGKIIPAKIFIEPVCIRVPTYRGHYESIRVFTKKSCTRENVIDIFNEFNESCRNGVYTKLNTKPDKAIVVLDRRPQPRFDVGIGNGMSIVVGDIEVVNNNMVTYHALGDNLAKGAAIGSLQVLELYINKIK